MVFFLLGANFYFSEPRSRAPKGAEWDREQRGWGKEKYNDIQGQLYKKVKIAEMAFFGLILKKAMLLDNLRSNL